MGRLENVSYRLQIWRHFGYLFVQFRAGYISKWIHLLRQRTTKVIFAPGSPISSSGKSRYAWDSTLNLYLRAPTKYGLYSAHGGIFGEQTARREYPGVPTFFFWFHRLLFASWYILFNKTEFLWLLMDPSIKPSVRERLKELLQPLIFLLLPRSIARIAMQDQNTHARILDFLSFSGKFTKLLLKISCKQSLDVPQTKNRRDSRNLTQIPKMKPCLKPEIHFQPAHHCWYLFLKVWGSIFPYYQLEEFHSIPGQRSESPWVILLKKQIGHVHSINIFIGNDAPVVLAWPSRWPKDFAAQIWKDQGSSRVPSHREKLGNRWE